MHLLGQILEAAAMRMVDCNNYDRKLVLRKPTLQVEPLTIELQLAFPREEIHAVGR